MEVMELISEHSKSSTMVQMVILEEEDLGRSGVNQWVKMSPKLGQILLFPFLCDLR